MRWKVMPLEHVFWSYIQPDFERDATGRSGMIEHKILFLPFTFDVWMKSVNHDIDRPGEGHFSNIITLSFSFIFRQPFPCDNNKSNDLRIRTTWLCAKVFFRLPSRHSSEVTRIRFPMAIVIELPPSVVVFLEASWRYYIYLLRWGFNWQCQSRDWMFWSRQHGGFEAYLATLEPIVTITLLSHSQKRLCFAKIEENVFVLRRQKCTEGRHNVCLRYVPGYTRLNQYNSRASFCMEMRGDIRLFGTKHKSVCRWAIWVASAALKNKQTRTKKFIFIKQNGDGEAKREEEKVKIHFFSLIGRFSSRLLILRVIKQRNNYRLPSSWSSTLSHYYICWRKKNIGDSRLIYEWCHFAAFPLISAFQLIDRHDHALLWHSWLMGLCLFMATHGPLLNITDKLHPTKWKVSVIISLLFCSVK